VHFLSKGGGEGGYLGEDLDGEETEQEWPKGWITGGSALWEREMRRIERVREEEERLSRTGIKRRTPVSLTPYRDPRASTRVAPFGCYVA
jgi:hypothetical protein